MIVRGVASGAVAQQIQELLERGRVAVSYTKEGSAVVFTPSFSLRGQPPASGDLSQGRSLTGVAIRLLDYQRG